MIKLSVIKYTNANAIEATWYDEVITPAVGVKGDPDYQPEEVTKTQLESIAYHATQKPLFVADVARLGGVAADHDALWNEVESAHVPPPPPTKEELNSKILEQISSIERSKGYPRGLRDFMLEQPGATAKAWYVKVKAIDDQVASLRAQLWP